VYSVDATRPLDQLDWSICAEASKYKNVWEYITPTVEKTTVAVPQEPVKVNISNYVTIPADTPEDRST
jgi:hypothetical protein